MLLSRLGLSSAACLIGLLATAQAQNPGPHAPVRSFTWIYTAEPSPGMRTWTLDASNQWHEVYPDGHEAKVFDVVIRGTVNGCPGSLASLSTDAFLDVFVPDRGCPVMAALFRRDNGAWKTMGLMQNIR